MASRDPKYWKEIKKKKRSKSEGREKKRGRAWARVCISELSEETTWAWIRRRLAHMATLTSRSRSLCSASLCPSRRSFRFSIFPFLFFDLCFDLGFICFILICGVDLCCAWRIWGVGWVRVCGGGVGGEMGRVSAFFLGLVFFGCLMC